MSDGEATGPSDSFSAGADFRVEAIRLGRVQTATMVMQDATSFLRNMYIVSTAAFAKSIAGVIAGEADAVESLANIRTGLESATQQFERMARISSELLATTDDETP